MHNRNAIDNQACESRILLYHVMQYHTGYRMLIKKDISCYIALCYIAYDILYYNVSNIVYDITLRHLLRYRMLYLLRYSNRISHSIIVCDIALDIYHDIVLQYVLAYHMVHHM